MIHWQQMKPQNCSQSHEGDVPVGRWIYHWERLPAQLTVLSATFGFGEDFDDREAEQSPIKIPPLMPWWRLGAIWESLSSPGWRFTALVEDQENGVYKSIICGQTLHSNNISASKDFLKLASLNSDPTLTFTSCPNNVPLYIIMFFLFYFFYILSMFLFICTL